LTELRAFLVSTRFAFAALLGLVLMRFSGRMRAASTSSFSRARASARLASCVEAAREDDEFAGGGHPAARQRLEPSIGVGREAQREDIDAELARGCDLVDILAARSRSGEKFLRDRTFGDVSHGLATRLPERKSRARRSDRGRAPRQLLTA
jgi:hypothetical protein